MEVSTRATSLRWATAAASIAANLPLSSRLLSAISWRVKSDASVLFVGALFVVGPLACVISSWRVAAGRPRAIAWHLVSLGVSFLLSLLMAPLLDGGTRELGEFLVAAVLFLFSFVSVLVLCAGSRQARRLASGVQKVQT